MATETVSQILEFIDLQAHGDYFAQLALSMGYDLLAEEKSATLFGEDNDLISAGRKIALERLQKKAFLNTSLEQKTKFGNERTSKLTFTGGDATNLSTSRFALSDFRYRKESMLSTLASLAEKEGITLEELISNLKRDAIQRELADRDEHLQKPDLQRTLLQRYLLKLDGIVDSIERLDELPIGWESVPVHLRTMIGDAHESYLLGQDISMAILCGACLEDAYKECLGRNKVKYLTDGITKANEMGLFPKNHPAYSASQEVKAARDQAAHNPRKFLEELARRQRTDLLVKSRFVLETLFAGKV